MADPEKMLNDEEFFADTVDIPKEGVEQHSKRECLKGAISKVAKSNEHMKKLIKPAKKLLIRYMLSISSVN